MFKYIIDQEGKKIPIEQFRMERRKSLCLIYLFLEEIRYYCEEIYDVIKEDVYISFVMARQEYELRDNTYILNKKKLLECYELENRNSFTPLNCGKQNSYRTQLLLDAKWYNFNLTFEKKYKTTNSMKLSRFQFSNPRYVSEHKLTYLDLKNIQIEKFQDNLFCKSMIKTVILPDTLKKISVGLFKKSCIENITINNKCESIEPNAFYDCLNLYSIIIPESIKFIKFKAFYNSRLLNVNFEHKKKSKITIYRFSFQGTNLIKKNFKMNPSVDVRYKGSKRNCLRWS